MATAGRASPLANTVDEDRAASSSIPTGRAFERALQTMRVGQCIMDEGDTPAEVLERINDVPVSAQLLIEADLAYSEAGECGGVGIAAKAQALLSILKEQQLEGREFSDTFTAVTLRLEALERLQAQEHDILKSWSHPTVREICGILRQDYFRVAAVEPLIGEGGHPNFEPARFAQRLLEFSASKGVA